MDGLLPFGDDTLLLWQALPVYSCNLSSRACHSLRLNQDLRVGLGLKLCSGPQAVATKQERSLVLQKVCKPLFGLPIVCR
jgi:hypothetical protein